MFTLVSELTKTPVGPDHQIHKVTTSARSLHPEGLRFIVTVVMHAFDAGDSLTRSRRVINTGDHLTEGAAA